MFGVAVTVAVLSAAYTAPRAVVIAWDAKRPAPILQRISGPTDTDDLRRLARETGFRLEFVGGNAYCFQSGMLGERDLLAQRAVYDQITQTAGSRRGLLDRAALGEKSWTALKERIASLLVADGVTGSALDNCRLVVIPDYKITMKVGERNIEFFPATSSMPQAGDLIEGAAPPRQAWEPVQAKTEGQQASMSVVASDMGPREQAVLIRQAAEMMEHYIARLVDDVAMSEKAAYQALSSLDSEDRIDTQASTLSAMSEGAQSYLSNAFCNDYRRLGFADPNQARGFVTAAALTRIDPVLVMLITVPTETGGLKTVTLVMPKIDFF